MARKKRVKTGFTQQFSEKFRNLVKNKTDTGMVREEIASGIGITDSQLFNFENDLATPTIDTLNKICEYFGVSSDYMLGLSPAESLSGNMKIAEFTTGLSRNAVYFLNALIEGQKNGSLICGDCLKAINALLSEKRFDDCQKFWENYFVFLFHPDMPFEAPLINGGKKFSAENVLALLISENEQYLRELRRDIQKSTVSKSKIRNKKKTASGTDDAGSGQ